MDLKRNIAEALTHTLKVKKPSGTIVTWSAELHGTDRLKYETVDGDLDEIGRYYIQPDFEFEDWEARAKTVYFTVYDFFD